MQTRPGKSVVLVSSGQPSANPRLVKEATCLFEAGYTVTVIYCRLSIWADKFDTTLFGKWNGIKWIAVGHHQLSGKWSFLLARLRKRWFELLFKFFPTPDNAIRSMVLYNQELMSESKKYKADLYIGHNLGALNVVVNAAKHNAAKCQFDFEDYHRGEFSEGSIEQGKIKIVENKYINCLDAITSASPLIASRYAEHFQRNLHVVNNCFSADYLSNEFIGKEERPLKLFWFSQYVGKNRGLECVLAALGLLKTKEVELNLLGSCTDEMRAYFLEYANSQGVSAEKVNFIEPVNEQEIVKIAASCHIGLATEVMHNENRALCLTNKIFMYLLAGNAILFSDTPAQRRFLDDFPGVGQLFSGSNAQDLAEKIEYYIGNAQELQTHRNNSRNLGISELNWELESKKFLDIVQSVLV